MACVTIALTWVKNRARMRIANGPVDLVPAELAQLFDRVPCGRTLVLQGCSPVVRKKSDPGLKNRFFTQRFSQAGIHDADRRESMSSQRGNRLECYVAEIEVQPSAKFGRAYPVPGWNVDAPDCNVPPTI